MTTLQEPPLGTLSPHCPVGEVEVVTVRVKAAPAPPPPFPNYQLRCQLSLHRHYLPIVDGELMSEVLSSPKQWW